MLFTLSFKLCEFTRTFLGWWTTVPWEWNNFMIQEGRSPSEPRGWEGDPVA